MSEQEERLQAIFNRNQSNNLVPTKSGVDSSIISTRDPRSQKKQPYVTAVRVGSQKLKHEFALKGPN